MIPLSPLSRPCTSPLGKHRFKIGPAWSESSIYDLRPFLLGRWETGGKDGATFGCILGLSCILTAVLALATVALLTPSLGAASRPSPEVEVAGRRWPLLRLDIRLENKKQTHLQHASSPGFRPTLSTHMFLFQSASLDFTLRGEIVD